MAESDPDDNDVAADILYQSKWTYRRNLAAFWILGLTNNFAYVVMLSAANDILKTNTTNGLNDTSDTGDGNRSGKLVPECNEIGTGAILLADIIPTLVIKLTAPFFMHLIPYSLRVMVILIFGAASFPIVSASKHVWLSLLGVVCASIGAGFGEITFLSLSSHFNKNVVSSWSSGTGAAGVFGALSYAGLTALGVSPRVTLLILLIVPAVMAVSYFLLLVKPHSVYVGIHCSNINDEYSPILQHEEDHPPDTTPQKVGTSLAHKFILIQPLIKYMVPLSLVYFAEYFINQALFELIYFQKIWLPKEQQYRWYQVIYQVGVFISRSSVNLIQVAKLWILPILQFGNVALLLCQIFFGFIPSIWIVFVIILFEGLLGGCAYVNTFYKISQEIPEEYREFSMGVASVADSTGITIAGIISVPIHNLICDL